MGISRRRLLGAAATTAAAVTGSLAGCGFVKSGQDSSSSSNTLSFTTWGTDAELAGFRSAIAQFEQRNAGSTIALNAVPYEQMFTNIDAQLQAGNPPDVFRVPYYTFGAYAGRGQLLDLSSHLPAETAQRFTPAAWAAVQNDGKPFGLPHHTDTSVIFYNKAALAQAGIRSVPDRASDAWSWEEFADVARRLRSAQPASRYPFAYNWQGSGVTRWLSWLFQANGRFLAEDLKTPAIDSAAGRRALDFTRGFFDKSFVPPNSSVKSSTYAADMWYAQTTAMVFSGAFAIPDATKNLKFGWGATFPPKDVRAGGDFGGNALVATAASKKPALAAAFLDFVTQQAPMREFCAGASLLPTRRDLTADGISFKVRPELSDVFVAQAGAVQARDSGQVASPSMSGIITVLKEQLDRAFVADADPGTTLRDIAAGIAAATKR